MAAGSVISEPRIGPRVRTDHHQALSEPPRTPATLRMIVSESCRIGLVAARVMITTTKIASVKLTR